MFNIPGIMTTLKMDIRDFQQNVKLAIKEAGSINKTLNDVVKETTSMGAVMGTAGATAATSMKQVTKSTADMTSVTKQAAAATGNLGKAAKDASVQVADLAKQHAKYARGFEQVAAEAQRTVQQLAAIRAGMQQSERAMNSFGARGNSVLAGLAARAQAVGVSFRTAFSRIGEGALGFSIMGAAMTGFSAVTLKTAASVQESENLFEVSMGAMADSTRAWSEEVSAATGTADLEVRKMVGTFNVMLDSMGFADEASASMSKNLTMLADDMASFYNLPVDEAFTKLSAGLSGETEPLKRLGILIDETSVKAYAMANGIGEVGRELTNGEKIVARYGLIMQNTTAAQGDLARTADSVTNQWRRAQGSLKMLSAELGQQLLPTAQKVLLLFNDIVPAVLAWTRANPDLASSIMAVATAGGVTVTALAAIGFVAPSVISALKGIAVIAGIAWAALLSGPGLIVASLAALGLAAKVLYDQFNISFPGAGKAVADFVDWSISKLSSLIKMGAKIADWASFVGSTIRDALYMGPELDPTFGRPREARKAGEWTAAEFGAGFMDSLKNLGSTAWGMLSGGMSKAATALGVEGIDEQVRKAMTYEMPSNDALMAGMREMMEGAGGAAAKAAEKVREAGESLFRSLRKDVDLLASATESLNELKAAGHLDNDTINLLGKDFWQKFGSDATGQIDAAIAGMQAMGGEMATLANAMRAAQEQARIDELKPQGIALDLELNPETALLQQTRADLESLAAAEKLTEENARALGMALSGSLGDLTDIQIDELTSKVRDLNEAVGQGVSIGRTEAMKAELDAMLAQIDPMNTALDDLRYKVELAAEAGVIDDRIGNLLATDIWNALRDTALKTVDEIEDALGTRLPMAIKKPLSDVEEEAKKVDKVGKMKEAQQGIASLGNAISSLGGKWKTVGDIFAAVQATMQIATGIMEKSISGVISGVGGLILLLGQLTKKAPEELKGIAKVMDEIKEASEEWIDSISEALLDFAKEGKAAWGELVEQIFDDIFKIAAAELLVKPIVNFGGSMLGFAKGGAFDGGRVVPFAKGGHVTEGPEFFPMAYGKTGVRGEAGREGVLPLERMANGDLGVQANMTRGDDRTIINIHDNRQHGEAVQVRESRTGDGRKQLDIFIADALGRLARSGDLDGIMGSRYGLQGRPA